jgi:hypothetical protein
VPALRGRQVSDEGIDLRVRGHVHGGVELSVRAQAGAAAAANLRQASWSVEGWAVEGSLQVPQKNPMKEP